MIVCRLKMGDLLRRTRKGVEVNAVLKCYCDVGACETDSQDSSLVLERDCLFLLRIIPYDDLRLRPSRILSSSDQG